MRQDLKKGNIEPIDGLSRQKPLSFFDETIIFFISLLAFIQHAMKHELKTTDPRRQFLTLLLCYFAIPVVKNIFAILQSGTHHLSYNWQRFFIENANIIDTLFGICTLFVLISLLKIKDYNIDKTYRAGLLLMMAPIIASTLMNLAKIISPETLSSVTLQHHSIYSNFILILHIIAIVGIFLFIDASPVDRKINVFIKCSPFIPSVLGTLLGFALFFESIESLLNIGSTLYLCTLYYTGLFIVNLAVLGTLVVLLRKRSS